MKTQLDRCQAIVQQLVQEMTVVLIIKLSLRTHTVLLRGVTVSTWLQQSHVVRAVT